MPRSDYREQVRRDVERTALSKEEREQCLESVCDVLAANPGMHYYQGYHDVAAHCSSTADLEQLSLRCLRDFMTPTLEPTLRVLALLPELIPAADHRLDKVMRSVPEPHFALAPLLTLFGHDTTDKAVLATVQSKVRQFGLGYLLYLYTAVMMYRRDAIVEQTDGEGPDVAHSVLSRMGGSLDGIEPEILWGAVESLRARIPLSRLPSYRRLSSYSALKTGPHISGDQARRALAELARPPPSSRRRIAVAIAIVVVGLLVQRARRH